MVCGVDDLMVCLAASVSTRADWVVDEAFVGAFEECYRNAKGNFDRRKEEEAMVHYQVVVKGGLFGIHTCCIHYRPSKWMIQSITSAVRSFLLHVS